MDALGFYGVVMWDACGMVFGGVVVVVVVTVVLMNQSVVGRVAEQPMRQKCVLLLLNRFKRQGSDVTFVPTDNHQKPLLRKR